MWLRDDLQGRSAAHPVRPSDYNWSRRSRRRRGRWKMTHWKMTDQYRLENADLVRHLAAVHFQRPRL